MEDNQVSAGGASAQVGNEGGEDNTENNAAGGHVEKSVSYASYQKLLDQKKQRDRELEERNAKLAEFEAERKSAEERKLREQKKFEELASKKEQELLEEKQRRESLEIQMRDGSKLNAFLSKIRQTHGDIGEQYWGLINLDSIQFDSDTGLPDADSVNEAVNNFANTFTQVLTVKDNSPNLPNGQGGKNKVGLSYEEWSKLPLAEQRKRIGEVKTE